MRPAILALSVCFLASTVVSANAGGLVFNITPIDVHPTMDTTIPCGGTLKIFGVDIEGSNVQITGSAHFEVPKSNLESLFIRLANASMPMPIPGAGIDVTRLKSIVLIPEANDMRVDIDFNINHFLEHQHASLAIDNKMFTSLAAATMVRIVPNSVHIRIGDQDLIDWVARFWKYHDIDIDTETALQKFFSKNVNMAKLLGAFPPSTEITAARMGYNSYNKKIYADIAFSMQVDKANLDDRIQSGLQQALNGFASAPMQEGRTVFAGASRQGLAPPK